MEIQYWVCSGGEGEEPTFVRVLHAKNWVLIRSAGRGTRGHCAHILTKCSARLSNDRAQSRTIVPAAVGCISHGR